MSMASMLTVRPATLADYDAVMDINDNIYFGFDYLFSKFVEYCHCPSYYPYVAEYGTKVVGYTCHAVIHNGSAVVGMAGRIHKDFQKRGFSKILYDEALRKTKEVIPTIQTVYAVNMMTEDPRDPNGNDDPFLKTWTAYSYMKSLDEISASLRKCILNEKLPFVKVLSFQEAINNLDQFSAFLSQYKWIVSENNFKPLLVNEANLMSIFRRNNMLVSYKSDQTIEGMSFHTFTQVRLGLRWDLFYYGTGENALVAHIGQGLRHVNNILPPWSLYFRIHFPHNLRSPSLDAKLTEILGERYMVQVVPKFAAVKCNL